MRPAPRPLDPDSPERVAYERVPRAGRIYDKAGGLCRHPSSRSMCLRIKLQNIANPAISLLP